MVIKGLNTLEEVSKLLQERYPNELPNSKIDDFELGRKVGQQDTINYILSIIEKGSSSNDKSPHIRK